MRIPTYALVATSTLCTIGAQLLLKKVISANDLAATASAPARFIFSVAVQPATWLAFALQATGYVVWFFVLSRGNVAVVFALSGSFFYVLMAATAWMFLGERLAVAQWWGILLISLGVMLMTYQRQNLS